MSTAPSLLEPHKAGRPRKFQQLEDFQAAIDAYFAERDRLEKPYTMHGLARALECSRTTLINYEHYDDAPAFVNTIKNARERVAEWTEDRLHQKGYHPAGAIFSLKNNFGWKDVQEVQVESRSVVLGVTVSLEQHRQELASIDDKIRQLANPQNQAQLCEVPSAGYALSPAAQNAIAPSPVSDIAVTVDSPEAKAPPSGGVSPASVA